MYNFTYIGKELCFIAHIISISAASPSTFVQAAALSRSTPRPRRPLYSNTHLFGPIGRPGGTTGNLGTVPSAVALVPEATQSPNLFHPVLSQGEAFASDNAQHSIFQFGSASGSNNHNSFGVASSTGILTLILFLK